MRFSKYIKHHRTLKSWEFIRDRSGEESTGEIESKVGNEPPEVAIYVHKNTDFYWENDEVNYTISVKHKEDGSVEDGKIDPKRVRAFFDFLQQESDRILIAQGHQQSNIDPGQVLIEDHGCKSCHALDKKSVGPNYRNIAARYKDRGNSGNADCKGNQWRQWRLGRDCNVCPPASDNRRGLKNDRLIFSL
jgi:hypothetical protein